MTASIVVSSNVEVKPTQQPTIRPGAFIRHAYASYACGIVVARGSIARGRIQGWLIRLGDGRQDFIPEDDAQIIAPADENGPDDGVQKQEEHTAWSSQRQTSTRRAVSEAVERFFQTYAWAIARAGTASPRNHTLIMNELRKAEQQAAQQLTRLAQEWAA